MHTSHAALLAVDEAVLFGGVEGVTAADFEALAANGGHHRVFDARLGGPTLLIGGEPQIAVGDELDLLLFEFARGPVRSHGGIDTSARAERLVLSKSQYEHR